MSIRVIIRTSQLFADCLPADEFPRVCLVFFFYRFHFCGHTSHHVKDQRRVGRGSWASFQLGFFLHVKQRGPRASGVKGVQVLGQSSEGTHVFSCRQCLLSLGLLLGHTWAYARNHTLCWSTHTNTWKQPSHSVAYRAAGGEGLIFKCKRKGANQWS